MTTIDNQNLLTNFMREVIDGQNLDAMGKYLSVNFLHHDQAPGEQTGEKTGLAGQQNFFKRVVFASFSGFTTTFDDLIGEADLVAGRWRQSSSNTGPWQGRAATGATTEIGGISVVRVRNGMLVEEWEARDSVSLLRQLGVPVPQLTVTAAQSAGQPGTPGPPAPFLANGPMGAGADAAQSGQLKSIVARVFVDGWGAGKLDVLGQVYAPGYVLHDPTGLVSGTQGGVADLITSFRGGMPGMAVSIDLMLAGADRVASRWTVRGKHASALFGVAATGRQVAVSGITISRLANDQIQEEWMLWDQLSLLQQVGAVP